jgi:hypothetical protein
MELQGDGVTMNNYEVDKVTDAELEGVAGGAKPTAEEQKKLAEIKRNAANEGDVVPKPKPKGK